MKLTIATAALAVLLTTGCRSKHHDDHIIVEQRPASQPATVIVEREHVHGSSCGHYYHNGVWYAEPEHIRVVEIRRD